MYTLTNPNFIGTDSFTFTASDGVLSSPPATVSIVVQPNTLTATSAYYSISHDTTLSVSARMVVEAIPLPRTRSDG